MKDLTVSQAASMLALRTVDVVERFNLSFEEQSVLADLVGGAFNKLRKLIEDNPPQIRAYNGQMAIYCGEEVLAHGTLTKCAQGIELIKKTPNAFVLALLEEPEIVRLGRCYHEVVNRKAKDGSL